MRRSYTLCLVGLVSFASATSAQPLVTGDLSVYYSFDEVTPDGLFPDGSGNDLHGLITFGFEDANEDELDDIRVNTADKVRGSGSALFDTEADFKEDYIAVCDPVNQPDHNEGCGEFLEDRPAYVPSTAFTVAAWVKPEDVGVDHSVWQSRAGGGGYIHTQIQGNGGVRMRLRGDSNSDNIVQFNEPPDGEIIEYEEWVHYAGTYEKGDDPEEPGEWTFYFNGVDVAGGEANGSVAGDPDFEVLGDWAQGAFIGLVPDFNRQLVGGIDEFYLFTRALAPEEIQTLFELTETGVLGDFNGNSQRDPADLDLLVDGVAAGDNAFDVDGDGDADADDRTFWVNNLTNTYFGDSNFDGEFSSADFVTVFGSAKYEAGQDATWAEGDWNGDKKFNSADFVAAFSGGGYEKGPREGGLAVVPEPSSMLILLIGMLGIQFVRKR
ncbi:LamG-like jellyroll fold domain-containing protein [Planctomycetota bacterium]